MLVLPWSKYKSKQNANTKIRAEQNKDNESKQEAMDTANQKKGTNLKQIVLELLRLLITENNI